MSDQVDEVKQKTDIVAIIGERVELKKAGRNYKALCPFHSEKTPSFMVSPELQMYKCFGCNEGGDAIAFLEKFEGMDFPEALKYLADRAGVKLAPFKGAGGSDKDRLYEVNSLASRFYNYVLTSHSLGKPGLDYLTKERGISLETIDKFQLGFSPETPGALSKYLINKKKFTLSEVERAGLVTGGGGRVYDRLRGRIIFPLFDHRGNVVGFAGRILPWTKTDLAKYVNTPETPIYHKGNVLYGLNLVRDEIKKTGYGVVVEGELDMISSWQAGVRNIVAIKGSALTVDQIRLLSRFTKKVILALDTDFAGDTAARRGIGIAQKAGFEIKVAKLGEFKDPDEAARKNVEAYKASLKNAVGVWDFIIDSVFFKSNANSGEGKGKISREVIPVLSSIEDKIVQAHYGQIVAKRLGVSVEVVFDEIVKFTSSEAREKPQVVNLAKKPEKGRRQLLEERLLGLIFQFNPKLALSLEVRELITTPITKRITEEYQKFSDSPIPYSPSAFTENLPKELVEGFAEIIFNIQDVPDDLAALEKEIELTKKELTILETRHKLEIFGVKIREYEDGKDSEKLKDAQLKFSELSQRLSSLERESKGGIILGNGR